MKKTYHFGNITYGFDIEFHKWVFTNGNYSINMKIKGVDTAHKIAKLVAGGLIQTKGNGIGSARANIDRLLKAAA